ncbi:hypothetical protein [Lysinibacillus sp. LZ02]|uniref:hypothetical protein n=1 Tax=Lysinibacillus sp. LZ02 TaxID=3420668 RepID=UPI003D36C4D8
MNIKKIATVSALTGALLIGSFAVGHAMGENSSDKAREKQVTELQIEKEDFMIVFKDMNEKLQAIQSESVSETYQITAITDEGIHGEIANGFGYEKIYYTHEELEKFGINFKLGDYVVITWPFESRDSRNVNDIEHMHMFAPMPLISSN